MSFAKHRASKLFVAIGLALTFYPSFSSSFLSQSTRAGSKPGFVVDQRDGCDGGQRVFKAIGCAGSLPLASHRPAHSTGEGVSQMAPREAVRRDDRRSERRTRQRGGGRCQAQNRHRSHDLFALSFRLSLTPPLSFSPSVLPPLRASMCAHCPTLRWRRARS